MLPGLIGRRVSGMMLSDPDWHREQREAEAEAEDADRREERAALE